MTEFKGKSPVKSLFKIISKDVSKAVSKDMSSKENRQLRKIVNEKKASGDNPESFQTLKKTTSSGQTTSKQTSNSPAPTSEVKQSATPLTLLNRDVTHDIINPGVQACRQRATVMFDTEDGGQFVVSYDAPRSNSRSRGNTSLNDSHSLPQASGKSDGGSILRVAATFSDDTRRDGSIKKLGIGVSERDATANRTSRRLEATFIQEDRPSECSCLNIRDGKNLHRTSESDVHKETESRKNYKKSASDSMILEKCDRNLSQEDDFKTEELFEDDIFVQSGEEDLDETFNCDQDDDAVSYVSDDTRSERSTSSNRKPSRIASYTKASHPKPELKRRSSLTSLSGQSTSSKSSLPKSTSSSRIPVLQGSTSSADRSMIVGSGLKPAGEAANKLVRRFSLTNMPKVNNSSSKLTRIETLPSKPKIASSRSVDRPSENSSSAKVPPSKIVRSTSIANSSELSGRLSAKPPVKPRRAGDKICANTSSSSLCSVGNISISSTTSVGSTATSADRVSCGSSTKNLRQKVSTSEPRPGVKVSPVGDLKASLAPGNSSKIWSNSAKGISNKKQDTSSEGSVRNISTSKLTTGQFLKRKEYDARKAIEEGRSKMKPPSGNRLLKSGDENDITGNLSLRSLNDVSLNSSWKNSSVASEPDKILKTSKSGINLGANSANKKITRTSSTVNTGRLSQVGLKTGATQERNPGRNSAARRPSSARSRMSSCSSDTSATSVSSFRGVAKQKNVPVASQSFCEAEKNDNRKPFDENSLELPNWAIEYLNDISKAKSDSGSVVEVKAQPPSVDPAKLESAENTPRSSSDKSVARNGSYSDDSLNQSTDGVDSSTDNFSRRVHRRASVILQQIQNGGMSKTAESFFSSDLNNLNSSHEKEVTVKNCV